MAHAAPQVLLPPGVEEAEEGVDYLGCREDFEFVGILDIHHFVAYIVGGLDYIYQGVAGKAQGLALGGEAEYAQLVGDAGIVVALADEEAEFTLGRQD